MRYARTQTFKYVVLSEQEYDTPYRGFEFEHDLFQLYKDGSLILRKGYRWDGPSGLTLDTKNSLVPAAVHDALYQLMRRGVIPVEERHMADDLFYKMLRARGMWKMRAWLWHRMVRRHGKQFAKPQPEWKVEVAP